MSEAALMRAIELNGQAVPSNRIAFGLGRLAVADAHALHRLEGVPEAAPRTQELLTAGTAKIAAIRGRVETIALKDKSKVFNTSRIEALEVENLMEVAQATIESAAARRECRGAHTVKDYERAADDPQFPLVRNDAEWMKHTLWFKDGNRLDYKPVQLKPLTVESVPPKVRTF